MPGTLPPCRLAVGPGLRRVRLGAPPARRISAARLAASYRSAATTSMLSEPKQTAEDLVSRERAGPLCYPAPPGGDARH
jgi:hypothetical protein